METRLKVKQRNAGQLGQAAEADAIGKIIRERALPVVVMAIADDGAQKALVDFVDDIRLIPLQPLDETMHLEELDVAQLCERCGNLRAEVVVLLSFHGGDYNTEVNTMRPIHSQRGGRGKFITGVFRRLEAGLPKNRVALICGRTHTTTMYRDVLRAAGSMPVAQHAPSHILDLRWHSG